jgi:SNF2 family DNA or RNA helicase
MISIDQRFAIYLKYSGLQHKEYQLEGVRWCIGNETRVIDEESPLGEALGGIVCDEMGLGKTIVMIGTFVSNILPNTLVIVPPVLIEQWRQQIKKTTGYEPLVYHGSNKKKVGAAELLDARIVIASYAAISVKKKGNHIGIDEKAEEDMGLLHQIEWSRIVFDEAHHLRNHGSAFRGACELKAGIRWLVTGTPIQNKKKDFYSLCTVLGLPRSFYTDFELLRANAKSFIMKRTKRQVGIDMTDVVQEKTMVSWTNSREKELSEEIHSNLKFSGVLVSGDRVGIDSITHGLAMTKIIRARQACVMPKLLTSCMTQFELEYYDQALHAYSKLNTVVEAILSKKDNGNGKLIFCNFKGEIDEVCARLLAGGMKRVVKLDGRTGNKARAAALSEKNDALVLQIRTGCEGLNLQDNYNEIYFVSPHWNPAVEDQAVARCHRIGQTKDVVVQRFEMSSFTQQKAENDNEQMTVEAYVNKVQEYKRYLADMIHFSKSGAKVERLNPLLQKWSKSEATKSTFTKVEQKWSD